MKQPFEDAAQARKSLARRLAAMAVVAGAMYANPAAAATLCYAGHNPASSSTVTGNLEVVANNSCTLQGVTVTGNVNVDAGAMLDASNTTIKGNLNALNPARVSVFDGTVGGDGNFGDGSAEEASFVCGTHFMGSVTVKGANGASNPGAWISGGDEKGLAVKCNGVAIDGSLYIRNNTGEVRIYVSTIKGSVSIQTNFNEVDVEDNKIGGDLTCNGNTTAPDHSGNTIGGRAYGQCL